MSVIGLLVLGIATSALAAPPPPRSWDLSVRLLDGTGVPISGDHKVTVTLYDHPTAGTARWTEDLLAVPFADGYATLRLGAVNPVGPAVLDYPALYAELSIDDGPPLGPRTPLSSVPYAHLAEHAVEASHVVVEGAASGACTDTGAIAFDTVLGQLRVCDGTSWVVVGSGGGGGGAAKGVPQGASCADVKAANPSAPDGDYWLDLTGGSNEDAQRVYCDFTGGWTHLIDYEDDNSFDDIPNDPATIAAGFATARASFVGSDFLNGFVFTDAEWCTSNGASTHCFPIHDTDFTYVGNHVDHLDGGKRRVIAALSGMIPDGVTEDGAWGRFYATPTAASPPICPAYPVAGLGYIQQWSLDVDSWHVWGNGLALYLQGPSGESPTNELSWGNKNRPDQTDCGPEWEHFFVRVKEPSAAAGAGQSPATAFASCAEAPSSGSWWIDPLGGGAATAVEVTCDVVGGWTYAAHYIDNDSTDDIPDVPSVIRAGFRSANGSYYVGNDIMNALPDATVEWCVSDGGASQHCWDILDTDWTYTLGHVNDLNGNKRRVVGALTGQIPDGNTENGANGRFYARAIDTEPPVCSSQLNTGGGFIQQWSGDDANWHTWGHGYSMYIDGSTRFGPTNEISWGFGNSTPSCSPFVWDHFLVRVK